MKKNNIFKVVCITVLLAVLLTWIFPSTYFNGTVLDNGRLQVGLVTLLEYFTVVIANFGYIPLYILVVGGFYGVLYKTSGYRNLLDKMVRMYKGNEWIFLTIVMIVFAAITSVSGITLGLFILFPFVITTILLMGYSKTTALLTTVGSICIGLLGTTYSVTNTGILNEILSLPASSELVTKLILLVVGLVVLIFNTLIYAKKHRIDGPRKGFLYPESTNPMTKTWPIVFVLDAVLVVMILSAISWSSVFEITFFDELVEKLTEFEISGFPIISKLFGTFRSFGNWQVTDFMNLTILSTLFVAFLCRVKFNDMIEGFGAGAKRCLRPAFLVSLIYVLIIITYYNPVTFTIVKPILDLTKSFNVVTMSGAALLSHVINVDLYYSAANVLPYVVKTFTDKNLYGLMGIIFQSTYGLAMLFVPSSAILVLGLSYLNVSYWRWLKAVWKIVLELLIILLVIFLIIAML